MAVEMGEVAVSLEAVEGMAREAEEEGEGDLIANVTTILISIP